MLLLALDQLLDLVLFLSFLLGKFFLVFCFDLSELFICLLVELLLVGLERFDPFEQAVTGVSDILSGLVGLVELALEVAEVELILMLHIAQFLLQVIIFRFDFFDLSKMSLIRSIELLL